MSGAPIDYTGHACAHCASLGCSIPCSAPGEPGHGPTGERPALEGRERTIAVQAMRKLSRTELVGLGVGLEAIVALETVLVETLPSMRAAAARETQARVARGYLGPGPASRAYVAQRRALLQLGLAREDTETAIDQGRVSRA